MESLTTVQGQQDKMPPDGESENVRRTPRFFSTGTIIVSSINLIICIIIEISLSWSYGWSAFGTEMMIGVLMAVSLFTLIFRGIISFIISAGVLGYLYIYHVSPFLFG